MKLQISPLRQNSKVTGVPDIGKLATDTTVLAIVKVTEPGYVPRSMSIRSRIDPCMMTVECRYGALSMLENDPRVVSVALQNPLQMID